MTQAPTPGPLTSESVKLLVKGDLLRVVRKCEDGPEAGSPVTFECADGNRIWINDDPDSWWFDRFTFIGRPDAEGWMPWSGNHFGENPVPGQMVLARTRMAKTPEPVKSEWIDWSSVIAFRLAPTAPVEASGSERWTEDMERERREADYERGFRDGQNSRPQPSGETREAVARLVDPKVWKKFDSLPNGGYAAHVTREQGIEWSVSLRPSLSAADAILALLSARPIALGGQQGVTADSLTQSVTDETMRALLSCKDVGTGRAHLAAIINALSTTPARAEAQDEGASGEWPEKWSGPCTVGNMIANLRTLPPEMPIYTAYHIPMDGEPSLLRVKRPTMSRERVDGITIKTGDESVPYSAVIWTQPQNPLEAHPSPTPAADADRVRIAVGALEKIENGTYRRGDHRKIAEKALAALKSTAAKEGGE